MCFSAVACSPSKQEPQSGASFQASKLIADKNIVEWDDSNNPKKIAYSFTTKLTNLKTTESIRGLKFQILNEEGEVVESLISEADGSLHWTETFEIDFYNMPVNSQGSSELLLRRKIIGLDLIRGSTDLLFTIDPWQDYTGKSKSPVHDLTKETNINLSAHTTYSEYYAAQVLKQKNHDLSNDAEVIAEDQTAEDEQRSQKEPEQEPKLESEQEQTAKKQSAQDTSGGFFLVKSIAMSKTPVEEWDVRNALHAELKLNYRVEFNLKYKLPNPRSGGQSAYLNVKDSEFEITTTFLSAHGKHMSFGHYNGEEKSVYIDSDTIRAKSYDGVIDYIKKIELRNPAIKLSRSLLIIDIKPVRSKEKSHNSEEMQRIPPARFAFNVILRDLGTNTSIDGIIKRPHELSELKSRIPTYYHSYLNLKPAEYVKMSKTLRDNLNQEVRKSDDPKLYADTNNLMYVAVHQNNEKLNARQIEDLKTILAKTYKQQKLSLKENDLLCDIWSEYLYDDSFNPEPSDKYLDLLNDNCKDANRNFMSQKATNSMSRFLIDTHKIEQNFQIRPLLMNLSPSKKVITMDSKETLYNIGSSFHAVRANSEIKGYEIRSGASPSIPVISIGAGGAIYNMYHAERSRGVEVHTNNVNFLTVEEQKLLFYTKSFQRCAAIHMKNGSLTEIMSLSNRGFFGYRNNPWNINKNGILICEDTTYLKEEIALNDYYYFINQTFRGRGALTDPFSSATLAWVLSLRGKQQFEDFEYFLSMMPENDEMDIKKGGPNEHMKKAYDQFTDLGLPVYPGVYIPNEDAMTLLEQAAPID